MYYVYVDWTLEEVPRAFYVGKGSGTRMNVRKRNEIHENIAGKYGLRREKVFESELESDAFKKEIELIESYRTYRPATGWGANLTLGGEGSSGHQMDEASRKARSLKLIGRPKPRFSDEHRSKLAAAKRGRKLSEEHKRKIRENARKFNPSPSEETRRKISDSLRNQVQSQETRQKRSESMRLAWMRRKQDIDV